MGKKHYYIEVSVGLFMVLSLLSFLFLALKVGNITHFNSAAGYQVTADFTEIGNLKVHAPVTIAGVKVGEVTKISLQPNDFNAKVTMRLHPEQGIPFSDTTARILTEGLIGSSYISIVPGFDEAEQNQQHLFLKEGDNIPKTQEAMILENLIGQLLFNIKK